MNIAMKGKSPMAKVIRNGRIEDDVRRIVRLSAEEQAETVALPAGPILVPFTVWRARADELAGRGDVGVWLDGGEGAESIAADIVGDGAASERPRPAAIGVNFPAFTDGRGFSTAALLRTRYGWRGELRAIGEVLRDQFFYFARCGFDTLQPPDGRYTDAQLGAALASLADFSDPYQGAVDDSRPLWLRRARTAVPV